jgi:hypothetical protein
VRRISIALAVVAIGAAVRYARRDLNAPADPSGAAVPLPRERAPLGRAADAHVVARPGEPDWVRDLARWVPSAPTSPFGRLLAYLWASPATLGGLLVGLASGGRPSLRDGVIVVAGARGPVAALLARGGFAATTLGHVVIARRDPSPALMAHELAHTRQAERFGPFTGPLYWYLLARYGYTRHPMERAARIAGRQARLAT